VGQLTLYVEGVYGVPSSPLIERKRNGGRSGAEYSEHQQGNLAKATPLSLVLSQK